MEPNAKIGCFFDEEPAEEEDYGMRKSISGIHASFSPKAKKEVQ